MKEELIVFIGVSLIIGLVFCLSALSYSNGLRDAKLNMVHKTTFDDVIKEYEFLIRQYNNLTNNLCVSGFTQYCNITYLNFTNFNITEGI